MKKLFFLLALLTISSSIIAQASFSEFQLSYGPYQVGYDNVPVPGEGDYDYLMEYTSKPSKRMLQTSIWYPASPRGQEQHVTLQDYMKVYAKDKEWEYLPEAELLNWFRYPPTPKNQQSIKETTKALHKSEPAKGKFPVVIYAPSYEASSIENFAWAEYLASHGYVVISSPSLGPENQYIGKNLRGGLEAQARDLKSLLEFAISLPFTDKNNVATAGFSFGGLSNVLFQMKNKKIKAILSLDGTIRYNYPLLKELYGTAIEKVDVPFLHMAQKVIPDEIMKEDKMDSKLNTEFSFYDELIYSDAYKLRFHDLTHLNFSSLDIVFRNRDPRQDKSDEKILQSYRLVLEYSLQFLNAYLKDDPEALQYLQTKSHPELVSKEVKSGKQKPYTFQEFHDLIKDQQYQNIRQLYDQVKQKYPDFIIQEGWLNVLGLQLIFNPTTAEEGIAIYEFALSLYPKSANLYDSLATGYFYLGRKKEAIEKFKKSLELYPQNQNAISKIKELGIN